MISNQPAKDTDPPIENLADYVSIIIAAQELDVSKWKIYSLIEEGAITQHGKAKLSKRGPRSTIIAKKDIEKIKSLDRDSWMGQIKKSNKK